MSSTLAQERTCSKLGRRFIHISDGKLRFGSTVKRKLGHSFAPLESVRAMSSGSCLPICIWIMMEALHISHIAKSLLLPANSARQADW